MGKMMIRGMNAGHAKVSEWGMTYLAAAFPASNGAGYVSGRRSAPSEIAELGCGGGRNIGELLKRYPAACVTAIDYSPLAVAQASAYNKKAIAERRCTIREGNVAASGLETGRYDLATAFETVYFWPGLAQCFAEAARILKPHGIFLIVNESDGTDAPSLRFAQIIDGMRTYTAEQITDALKEAGFTAVSANHHPSKPWIAVLAEK